MKEWTIMVYMAGDNNLSTEMVYALEQIKSVKNNNVDLFVYFDGLSGDVPTLYCDFSDPNSPVNFYQSYRIKNKLIDVKDEFNENSAAVDNIINFIDWCVKKDSEDERKKKKYAFVFSGHSIGFLNWGLFKDAKAGYYMTHAKLGYMFERVTSGEKWLSDKAKDDEEEHIKKYNKSWTPERKAERTTVVLGKKLDLLGFDSCVMSSLEVGNQFRRFAKVMVASEGSIPTSGWNYAQVLLGRLFTNPNSEAKEVAISFVDEFIKQQNKFALADISVDMAAWDLEALGKKVEPAFAALVDALHECFPDDEDKIENTTYQQMRRLLAFVHWRCQTYMLEQNVDLVDFCQLLIEEIDLLKNDLSKEAMKSILAVQDECQKVIESVRDCILLIGFSGGDFQFSNGISLFFPWSLASYESAQYDYRKLRFISDEEVGKKWDKFLEKYLGNVTFRRSEAITKTISDSSVVYESYSNMRGGGSGEDEKKQPPNSGRQPPNSGRQPPNSGRMIDETSVFLSRFMKLKNFEFNWNRTGFKSKHVVFADQTDRATASRPVPGKLVIDIPRPRTIQDRIQLLLDRLSALSEFTDVKKVQRYGELLMRLLDNSDESAIVKIIADLEHSVTVISEDRFIDGLRRAVDASAIDDAAKLKFKTDLTNVK